MKIILNKFSYIKFPKKTKGETGNEPNLTIVNTFVFHSLHPNITLSVIITCKTTQKLASLKCGVGEWKKAGL